jgi:predicted tellurium resistance membrane protein TerC
MSLLLHLLNRYVTLVKRKALVVGLALAVVLSICSVFRVHIMLTCVVLPVHRVQVLLVLFDCGRLAEN